MPLAYINQMQDAGSNLGGGESLALSFGGELTICCQVFTVKRLYIWVNTHHKVPTKATTHTKSKKSPIFKISVSDPEM